MAQFVDVTLEAVADADGIADLVFQGPGIMQEVLHVEAISLRTVGSSTLPNVTLYRGQPTTGRRLAFNQDGRSGHFRRSGDADIINGGDTWTVRFANATAGAVCSAALVGTITRRGIRA